MQNVEIHMPSPGHVGAIEVGGEPVKGVTGFTLTGRVGDVARLTLDLAVHPTDFFGTADVFVSDRARETLIRFGWAPPAVVLAKGGEDA